MAPTLAEPTIVVRWHDGTREQAARFYHQVNAEQEAAYRRRQGHTVRVTR